MPGDQGPEPTSWELMRGLERVEKALQLLSAGAVTQTTFTLHQQQQAEKTKDLENDITAVKTELAEAKKTKAQQWFGIGIALLGGVVSIIVAFILKFGGVA